MVQAPCKGCEERHTSCHSHCDMYKEYKKLYDEDIRKQREYKERDREYFAYKQASSKHRTKKRKPRYNEDDDR